jgi:hypothetical protein
MSPAPPPSLPPEWREFVGHWLEAEGCAIKPAARGDWEVDLAAPAPPLAPPARCG